MVGVGIAVGVRLRLRLRLRLMLRLMPRLGRGSGDYFLTSYSIFYGRIGQIAIFSHGQP